MNDYPALDLNAVMGLLPIREQLNANPNWLDEAECPYGADVRTALKTLFPPATASAVTGKGKTGGKGKTQISEEQAAVIEEEAISLLKELKELKAPAGKGLDHDTKISIIKAKTSLIEKVVLIQERFYNVHRVSNFQKTVVGILDRLIEPDRRNDMLKELEPYL